MNWRSFSKALGPGVLFASTAIGVSHLVQSTRAGADYGFALVWFIIAANVFKFPFFEFASRYAVATGESIIDGYKKLGNWILWVYFIITIISMFLVTSAVGLVTSGFLQNLFNIGAPFGFKLFTTTILFLVCVAILYFGKFKLLDGLIKVIGVVMLITTTVAFVLTLSHGEVEKIDGFIEPVIFDEKGILFVIALMGWMPTAVDISTWSSLWTVEKFKTTTHKFTLKEVIFEFNFGYWVSAVLALFFVVMGAYIMYGSGNVLSDGAAAFSNQVVNLYTATIGQWSYIFIAAAAFSIMFGTCLGVFDGFSRAFERSALLIFQKPGDSPKSSKLYQMALVIIGIGSYLIIVLFSEDKEGFKKLVDLATSVSFLISPVIAVVNFYLMKEKFIGKEAKPSLFLNILAYLGIIFLTAFAVYYCWIIF